MTPCQVPSVYEHVGALTDALHAITSLPLSTDYDASNDEIARDLVDALEDAGYRLCSVEPDGLQITRQTRRSDGTVEVVGTIPESLAQLVSPPLDVSLEPVDVPRTRTFDAGRRS